MTHCGVTPIFKEIIYIIYFLLKQQTININFSSNILHRKILSSPLNLIKHTVPTRAELGAELQP